MNLLWAAVGAASGLLSGAAFRLPVFRLAVASGAPVRSADSPAIATVTPVAAVSPRSASRSATQVVSSIESGLSSVVASSR